MSAGSSKQGQAQATPPPGASVTAQNLDQLTITTIRTLAMDAVQQANSGHPGTPMALAPVGYTLWRQFLTYHPSFPDWPNRDRFVLSAGHASMLLYALLHLAGVKQAGAAGQAGVAPAITLADLQAFRQLDSKTPGHPEYRHTTGVETTTGPLGQGYANSVGMAMAQRWLAARYNVGELRLFDYHVYALGGDGDMMEGLSSEAASLAGHLKLGNLCWIYDNNTITIEGHTALAFGDDVAQRFRSYGWHTLHVADANDTRALAEAYAEARRTTDKPTLMVVDSVIGYGSPHKHNTSAAHGEPLGVEEIRLTKQAYGWPEDAQFLVPEAVRDHLHDAMLERAEPAYARWLEELAQLAEQQPQRAIELQQMCTGQLPEHWPDAPLEFPTDAKGVASRDAGGLAVNHLAQRIPWLIGGAADLAPSTKTALKFDGAGNFQADNHAGRNLHFGIREHAMGAIANGMALSYVRPFTATFLVFSDYMKPTLRLAALMQLPVIFVFTHDSIGVGEDGPTHQPVEQLAQLRSIPGLLTLRPCDANETVEAWHIAISQTNRPSCLILSRQALPTLDRQRYQAAEGTRRGAYILADADQASAQVILLATGSEVSLCVTAYEALQGMGIAARVVSMPCWELFEEQSAAYRESVLPSALTARVAVEQAGPFGWDRYVGASGAKIVMTGFGASAPLPQLQEKFGFTVQHIVQAARRQIDLVATRNTQT